MAWFNGRTLSFGFSIEDQLNNIQAFFSALTYVETHFPSSSTVSYAYADQKYSVLNEDPFGAPIHGEIAFVGDFSPPREIFADIEGRVKSFSVKYNEFCGLSNCNNISGSFRVSKIGTHNIELYQLLGLWTSRKVTALITKGSDHIIGSNYSDTLVGGKGNDVLNGGGGNDVLNGGAGADTAVFSGANNRVNLNSTAWQNTGDGRDRLVQIERVNSGGGNDRITGNKGANVLNGGAGNDVLSGGGGNDQLIGGAGVDTAVFSGANNRVNLNSTGWQVTGDGRDRLVQIERVNAGAGKDVVTGNRFANVLSGGSGNDVLNGGGGNDQLIGGPGIDRLKGGLGRDTFRIQKGAGYDIIEDFNNGQDRLLLGSGKSRLRIKANSGDALIYQGSDLLARIDNAEGQIQVSGNYLI